MWQTAPVNYNPLSVVAGGAHSAPKPTVLALYMTVWAIVNYTAIKLSYITTGSHYKNASVETDFKHYGKYGLQILSIREKICEKTKIISLKKLNQLVRSSLFVGCFLSRYELLLLLTKYRGITKWGTRPLNGGRSLTGVLSSCDRR